MKRLGGFARLWIVLAVILAVVTMMNSLFVKDYDVAVPRSLALAKGYAGPNRCLPGTIVLQDKYIGSGNFFDKLEKGEIVPPPPSGFLLEKDSPDWEVHASCTSWMGLFRAAGIGFGLALLVLVAGFSAKWIYRGFRSQKA